MSPNETMFVVLNKKATMDQLEQGNKKLYLPKLVERQKIKGEWLLEFYPKLENRFVETFHQLSDFKYNTDKRIMYFSGTVVYKRNLMYQRKC